MSAWRQEVERPGQGWPLAMAGAAAFVTCLPVLTLIQGWDLFLVLAIVSFPFTICFAPLALSLSTRTFRTCAAAPGGERAQAVIAAVLSATTLIVSALLLLGILMYATSGGS